MYEFFTPDGIARQIICIELALLVLAEFGCVWAAMRVFLQRSSRPRICTQSLLAFVSLSFSSALLCNQLLSSGRPVAAIGVLMPGSILCRWPVLDLPGWLQRLAEPAMWLWASLLIIEIATAKHDKTRNFRQVNLYLLSTVLCAEALLSTAAFRSLMSPGLIRSLIVGFHFFLIQVLLIWSTAQRALSLRFGEFSPPETLKAPSVEGGFSAARVFVCGALVGLLFCSCIEIIFSEHRTLKVGAHYYSWFPENWGHGYAASKYNPPVVPLLGEYSSADEEVFKTHVRWAKQGGIDFFIFDWWPQRPFIRKYIFDHVRKSLTEPDFKFSIHYEALDLKAEADKFSDGVPHNVIYMTPGRARAMRSHWVHLAKHYMGRANYFRIAGRPVLFVYASRHITGPAAQAIADAKREVLLKTGMELYLVGDEVYFNVMSSSKKRRVFMLPELVPNWERLSVFDAITAYNPCDFGKLRHGGTKGLPKFLRDVARLYGSYRKIAEKLGIVFVPSVIPGYNDRGVRPKQDHFVIPRYIGEGRETVFTRTIKDWALPNLNSEHPLLVVTSWNEWNEGTNIEPSVESELTCRDATSDGRHYSQGECLAGDGLRLIHELQRVTRRERRPSGQR